jgi:hypothetical protein
MADQLTRDDSAQEHAPEEHLPEGENPINAPAHHLDASPPQPNVPQEGELPPQQDQQPVEPGPLLHRVEEKGGKQRELRNG